LVRAAFMFAFHHEDFNRLSFWSSSFFALEGLIVSLAGYELISGSGKVQLSPFERVTIGAALVCTVFWVGLILYRKGVAH